MVNILRVFVFTVFFLFLQGFHSSSKNFSNENTKIIQKEKKIVSSFVRNYVQLFKTYTLAFAPYNKSKMTYKKAIMVFEDKVFIKDKYPNIYKNKKELISLFKASFQDKTYEKTYAFLLQDLKEKSLQILPFYQRLRKNYEKAFLDYNNLALQLILNGTDIEKINKELELLMTKKNKDFLFDNTNTLSHLEKNIMYSPLFSPWVIELIKGNFFTLDISDMIKAVNQIIDNYLSILEKKIQNGDNLTCISCDEIFTLKTSSITLKKFSVDEYLKKIITKYSLKDIYLFNLLVNNNFQRAIWLLREKGEYKLSIDLENELINTIFKTGTQLSLKKLGMGFTNTEKVDFIYDFRLIFKPYVPFYKSPLLNISSNYKAEVAAYELDKILGLNMVPLTFLGQYGDKNWGSNQYFVKNSYRARDLRPYNGLLPRKFDTPKGRNRKTRNILFFDWLLNNLDRNVDNYLILNTGKFVLIDHGFVFIKWSSLRFSSKNDLNKMIPSRKIHANMKAISKNFDFFRYHLKGFLSDNEIRMIFKKIKFLTNFIDSQIKIKGRDFVFSASDEEEKKYGLCY